MNQEKINLRQVRDFGETFNASIKLVRQNFRLFFQSLLFIAGPFLLMSSIAGAFYQANALVASARMQEAILANSFTNPMDAVLNQFGWPYLIFILASILSNLALVGTVFSFILTYAEKGPGQFTVSDVGNKLIQNIGGIIAIFLGLLFITIIALAILVGLGFALGSVSPALIVLFALGLFVGMLILFPPLIWQLSVIYLVRMDEGLGLILAFGKTRRVMQGSFWWTWVIVFCSSFGIGIAGIVFSLPQIAYQMVLTFSNIGSGDTEVSIPFIIVATICTFCTTLLYGFLYIINGVHYFSLAEKKDGKGMMERINEIGNTPNTNVQQQY